MFSPSAIFLINILLLFLKIKKIITAGLVVMWETRRDRKGDYIFPRHDLVCLSLHTQRRVFQGIVENSFG